MGPEKAHYINNLITLMCMAAAFMIFSGRLPMKRSFPFIEKNRVVILWVVALASLIPLYEVLAYLLHWPYLFKQSWEVKQG